MGFGTIHSFRYPLGVLGSIPMDTKGYYSYLMNSHSDVRAYWQGYGGGRRKEQEADADHQT